MKNGWLEIHLSDANAQGYVGVEEQCNRDSCCFDGDAHFGVYRWFGKLQGQDRDTRCFLSRKIHGSWSWKKRLCALLGLAMEVGSRLQSVDLVYAIYDVREWW